MQGGPKCTGSDSRPQARNFITSPAKRGGYGVVGTTFGEYEYIPQREGGAVRGGRWATLVRSFP